MTRYQDSLWHPPCPPPLPSAAPADLRVPTCDGSETAPPPTPAEGQPSPPPLALSDDDYRWMALL